MTRLELTRAQILAHRRRAGELVERLAPGDDAVRRAAWAGLTDSMPRAAVMSLHARVAGTGPDGWEHPALVQVWGPRFSAYAVPALDVAAFTLGRLPDSPAKRAFAETLADDLERFLDGRRLDAGEAGRALGFHPNALRYAAPTGRVRIRWDGARRPTVWTVPAPEVDPAEARADLVRRHLHVMGPSSPVPFGDWAGLRPPAARAAFDSLEGSLTPVATPIGDAWILTEDEASFRAAAATVERTQARLLPSGDAYWLLQGRDRELLVPDARHRPRLWTPRVWPGAVLLGDEIAGTWRRSDTSLTIEPWRVLTAPEREAVEAEAVALPLPGAEGRIRVTWAK